MKSSLMYEENRLRKALSKTKKIHWNIATEFDGNSDEEQLAKEKKGVPSSG